MHRTGEVLSSTRNRAVLTVFVRGLKSSNADVRAATIRAALRRQDAATHTLLVRHFGELSGNDQATFAQAHMAMPHHAAPVLRRSILGSDEILCKNACRIVTMAGDFDLFPVLVKAAEDKKHRCHAEVTAAILSLASRVAHDVANWKTGVHATQHDPSFARHHLLASLEQAMSRFAQHHRKEILDAFLLLAPIENRTLNRILHDPNHPSHQALVAELKTTRDPGIIERFVEMIRDTEAPAAALQIIAHRSDELFVDTLLSGLRRPVSVRALHNMKRLQHVAWLEERRELLGGFDGRSQAVAIELALASSMPTDSIFELVAYLMQYGMTEARRACCQAMSRFATPRADGIVLAALNDPDVGVQAAAVRQLRSRQIPDALERLVGLLDARSPEVREAARSSLAEFNFTRYRTMFDLLDEHAAHSTGILVHKVDPSAPQKLAEDLAAPSITVKLRAIEMALAMDAADDIRQPLIDMVRHENLTIRKEVIRALGRCHGDHVAAALQAAADDSNHSIAETARESLNEFQRRNVASPSLAHVGGKSQ